MRSYGGHPSRDLSAKDGLPSVALGERLDSPPSLQETPMRSYGGHPSLASSLSEGWYRYVGTRKVATPRTSNLSASLRNFPEYIPTPSAHDLCYCVRAGLFVLGSGAGSNLSVDCRRAPLSSAFGRCPRRHTDDVPD
jgi:hypothetical protein